MTQFFFDLDDGRRFIRDEIGIKCVDTHAIRANVAKTLAAILRDNVSISSITKSEDADQQALTISVRDTKNSVIYTVMLTFTGIWQIDNNPIFSEYIE